MACRVHALVQDADDVHAVDALYEENDVATDAEAAVALSDVIAGSTTTRVLGDAFDEVILYQDAAQRGRGDGEVMALLREGLSQARRTKRIDEIRGEFLAIDAALERLEPGDLCLILVDQVEEALAHLAQRIAQSTATPAV